jgi:hypothetical protein
MRARGSGDNLILADGIGSVQLPVMEGAPPFGLGRLSSGSEETFAQCLPRSSSSSTFTEHTESDYAKQVGEHMSELFRV